jgi:hypothetical protein
MVLDESNLGMRDILFYQSIELVSNEIPCMLIGCGLNYFQNYYGHEFGMYPHNYLSESIISFGLFITIGMIIAIILGFLIYLRSETKSTLFILLLGYFLIVALKGGYFIGHWFVNASFIFFLCYIFKIAHLNMKRKIIVPS